MQVDLVHALVLADYVHEPVAVYVYEAGANIPYVIATDPDLGGLGQRPGGIVNPSRAVIDVNFVTVPSRVVQKVRQPVTVHVRHAYPEFVAGDVRKIHWHRIRGQHPCSTTVDIDGRGGVLLAPHDVDATVAVYVDKQGAWVSRSSVGNGHGDCPGRIVGPPRSVIHVDLVDRARGVSAQEV